MSGQKPKLLIVLLLFILSVFFSFISPQIASADYTVPAGQTCNDGTTQPTRGVDNNGAVTFSCPDATNTGAGAQPVGGTGRLGATAEGTTCAVEKIGWILCPLIEGTAYMADQLFKFLAKFFLEVQPELFDENSGTRASWEQARNLANIMFVIAFVILIYSQITGGLMSNYGMKRMLPRLIIAAIAVNVSFYICQAMVDVSNLLGFNIMQAMQELHAQQNLPNVMGADGSGTPNTQTSQGILGKIAIGTLAVTGFVWVLLALLGGMAGGVLITCLVIVVMLLLRKAFIILLIVLSPLAFVAYLLPNTEKYFKKWLNMFWQLLMVFPIVALLMGSGLLASGIILAAGLQTSGQQCQPPATANVQFTEEGLPECEPTVAIGAQQAPMSLGLAAVGIAVFPLLFVWSVLKGALAAAGAIGGKIASSVESGAKGAGNSGKQLAKAVGDHTTMGAGIKAGFHARKGARQWKRQKKLAGALAETDPRNLGFYARQRRRVALKAAGGEHAREELIAGAASEEQKMKTEQQSQEASLLDKRLTGIQGQDVDMLVEAIGDAHQHGNAAKIKAASDMLGKMGESGASGLRRAVTDIDRHPGTRMDNNGVMRYGNDAQDEAVRHMQGFMASAHAGLKSTDVDLNEWFKGRNRNITDIRNDAGVWAGLENEKLATQRNESIGSTGGTGALGLRRAWFDKNGIRHVTSRGREVLASDYGSTISSGRYDVRTVNGRTVRRDRFDIP